MKVSVMIEYIRGTIEDIDESTIHLRMGDITVGVLAPGFFIRQVSVGQSLNIPVYFHFQMEGNRIVPILVGFPNKRDREFFTDFISVSGVGVKAAVKALAQSPEDIACAIASADHSYLTTLPGIGLKRAKLIIAKLQDSMKRTYGIKARVTAETGATGEARAVLGQLGIPSGEAGALLQKASAELGDGAGASKLVKYVMKNRGKR